jgi:hypothetical protein
MKRVIFVFFGVLVGGFTLAAGFSLLWPVNWEKGAKGIGMLAVLFAVAVAYDDSWRRAAQRRRPGNGLPPGGPATMPPSPGRQASSESAPLPRVSAGEAGGSGAATGDDEHTFVFRPHPEPMLACALCLAVAPMLYLSGGINKPFRVLDALGIPGPAVVGVCLAGAIVYFYLFLRNCRRARRIVVDTSGIALPGRGLVTWEEITTVKRHRAPYLQSMAPVQIELNDRRHLRIRWPYETGKFYEAVQTCFEEHERRAGPACTAAGMNRKEPAL